MIVTMKRSTVAGIVAVLVSPVVAWWVTEEITRSSMLTGPDLDYVMHPVDLSLAVQRGIGITATAILLGALTLLMRDRRKGILAGFNLLILAGAIVGYAYAVFTWGSIGANIGVGLVIMFGTPSFAICVLLAVRGLYRVRRRSEFPQPSHHIVILD